MKTKRIEINPLKTVYSKVTSWNLRNCWKRNLSSRFITLKKTSLFQGLFAATKPLFPRPLLIAYFTAMQLFFIVPGTTRDIIRHSMTSPAERMSFPETLNVEVNRKQNSPFPVGSVINCFVAASQLINRKKCEKIICLTPPGTTILLRWFWRACRNSRCCFIRDMVSEFWLTTSGTFSFIQKTSLSWKV